MPGRKVRCKGCGKHYLTGQPHACKPEDLQATHDLNRQQEVAKRYGLTLEEAKKRIAEGRIMDPVSFGEVAASLAGQYQLPLEKDSMLMAVRKRMKDMLRCPTCDKLVTADHVCPTVVKFPSGAQRESQQLAYYDMPFESLDRVAKIAHDGMTRYGERNWTMGIPQSNFFDHAIEHLRKWRTGDLSEDHLAKAAWNILALMHGEGPKDQSPV